MLTFGETSFQALLEESRAVCLQLEVPCRDTVLQILAGCQEPFAKRDAAEVAVQQLKRKKASKEEIQAANKEYEEAKAAATRSLDDALMSLIPFLDEDIRLDLEPPTLHVHLMKCAIIAHQGSRSMSQFCDSHGTRYAEELLSNEDIMRDMLVNGGAKNGKYLEAYKLFDELMDMIPREDIDFYECHRRLALGCALELVVPIAIFGTMDVFVDPKQRFLHYANAHKNGELDPMFPYFSTWEYRYIVDSDAEDEELQWGRDHLKRYHPDMIKCRVPKFTYCKEVKTDVGYRTPHWEDGHRNYRNLLSGGGKCGPRAWMGRFLCKSFGMPTFGCRQPGHAAMIRYVPDKGWITCFGGGIQVSWWEDRDGLEFQSEAHSRLFQRDQTIYFQRVTLLECMATAYSEPSVGRDCKFQGPNMFWNALVCARRRYWSGKANTEAFRLGPRNGEKPGDCAIKTFLSRKDRPKDDNKIEALDDDLIFIPACAFKKKQHVSLFLSFEGGGQVHFEPDHQGSISYKLPAHVERRQYDLRLKMCTVHRAHEKDSFIVSVNGSEMGHIPCLYTVGEWMETTPIALEIGPGDEVSLKRNCASGHIWGLSMKSLAFRSS